MSRVLLLFVDGVGIGRPDAMSNPLLAAPILGNFLPDDWQPPAGGGRPERLPEPVRRQPVPWGGGVRAIDASLGFPGLPQSATGQTTLFTGVNGAALLGHHLYGHPGPRLRQALMNHSILKRVSGRGRPAAFLNAFPPIFFEMGDAVWGQRMGAASWNNRAAGLPFMSFDDLRAGRAVFHDFTHREARARGFDLPLRHPAEAGRALASAATAYDLAIYEFFLTDRVGHTGLLDRARALVDDLETFLAAVLQGTDLTSAHVVLTSDHGNVEDMSTRSHTLNPVPAMVWGPRATALASQLVRLEDFTAVLLEEIVGVAA